MKPSTRLLIPTTLIAVVGVALCITLLRAPSEPPHPASGHEARPVPGPATADLARLALAETPGGGHFSSAQPGLLAIAEEAFAHPAGRDGEADSMPPRAFGQAIDPQSAAVPLAAGGKASARGTVNGATTPELIPNQVGEFPRIYAESRQEVAVRVRLPEAQPGERVVAAVEDGGRFSDGKPVQVFDLDARREIAFRFVSDAEPGIYRITVRHGAEVKVVQIWAGDPALATNH